MPANSVVTIGWTEFAKKSEALAKLLPEELDFAAGEAAESWVRRASRAAPKDFGFLGAGISPLKLKSGEWEVVSSKEYSAWVEWGTRLKVSVPAELAEYAIQFKGGTGGAGNPKDMIFAWCKRKGLPPNAWFPVFMSIMRTGIRPQPFFFVQKPFIEKQLLEDLKQILSER